MDCNVFARGDYAGFVRRVLANLIDGLLLGVVWLFNRFVLLKAIISQISSELAAGGDPMTTMNTIQTVTWIVFGFNMACFVAYMVGFKWIRGATPGYSALGIKLVSMNGAPLTLLQATVRFLVSLCSQLALGLGFFWIIFDKKKQAWHDKVSGTYVVRASAQLRESEPTPWSHWFRPGLLAGVVTATAVILVSLFASLVLVIKSSDVYREATTYIENNPTIIELVGTPLRFGLMPTLHIDYSEDLAGEIVVTAVVEMEVHGRDGNVIVNVVLQKEEDAWVVTEAKRILTAAEAAEYFDEERRPAVSYGQIAELRNAADRAAELRAQGRYQEALPFAEEALRLSEQEFGLDHPNVATSLNNLAVLYKSQGRYADAEPLHQRALAIRETALGPEHPLAAQSLNNLAGLYQAQGRYAEAEPLYQSSLVIWQKALGPEHPDVAMSLNNLAGLYDAQGRYDEAEPLYQSSLAIAESALGPEHPDVAGSLNNLAALYGAQGRHAEAEPLYQRALAIVEKALGPEHPHVAASLYNLAALYEAQGRYAEAEPLYQRALAIRE